MSCGLPADTRQGLTATPGTLFHAFSTAKGVASAVAHVLVERGELTYDMRAAEVWPELGAHGKQGITLRHVLMHTAGLPARPYDTTVEDLCDDPARRGGRSALRRPGAAPRPGGSPGAGARPGAGSA